MKSVLFITHSFGRSGSEMLLLYMIKNLNREQFKLSLFSQSRGELLRELPDDVKSYVSYRKSKYILKRMFRFILLLFRIQPVSYQLTKIQNQTKADFWYVNTIVNPNVYAVAKKLGVRVITHVHELLTAYNFNSANEMKQIVTDSELCIGCSKIVCDKIADMGHKNIKLLYSFIDPDKINTNLEKIVAREKIGLNTDDFVWAISGQTDLTKGIEFVIPLLKCLKRLNSNAKIIWIGKEVGRGVNFYVKETIRNHFDGKAIFLGEQKEFYYDYLNCADAFLLLSREDSFPLVMLEAAYLGKPIVSFDSGGSKEFIDSEMGVVVDNWGTEYLADAMLKIEAKHLQFDTETIKAKVLPFIAANQIEKLESILLEF